MQQDIDWLAIRADYEQGVSLRSLSARYGPGKSTIHERALAELWMRPEVVRTPDVAPRTTDNTRTVPHDASQRPPEPSTVELARTAIAQLATIARVPMDLKEHTLFAQALNQYNKIIVTAAPAQEQSNVRIDYSHLTQEELEEVAKIFATADARVRDNITPFRKEA